MKNSIASTAVEPSLSRHLFNLAKQYDNVVDLTLGDPDLLPPERARRAACEAIMAGKTRYSANAGLLQLREAYAHQFEQDYGLPLDPQTQLAVTVGGMEALFLTLACIVDPGDEVVLFAPHYVNYVQMVRMCGGVPVAVELSGQGGFAFSAEKLKSAVTDKTVAIIVNSPCNPTGMVLSRGDLAEIACIAEENDLLIVSDEVYKTLLYDGRKHESIATLPSMRERTVIIDSASKRFAMTGYRVGFVAAPEALVENIVKMQENVAACAPLPSQYAALAAYGECADDAQAIATTFEERRDFICSRIANTPGLSCAKPAGAFYLFVDVGDLGMSGLDFAYELLKQEQVAVVPGVTYGEAYGSYVRIAYTLDIAQLSEACDRIARFANSRQGASL